MIMVNSAIVVDNATYDLSVTLAKISADGVVAVNWKFVIVVGL